MEFLSSCQNLMLLYFVKDYIYLFITQKEMRGRSEWLNWNVYGCSFKDGEYWLSFLIPLFREKINYCLYLLLQLEQAILI